MRHLLVVVLLALAADVSSTRAEVVLDLGAARLVIDDAGRAGPLTFQDGAAWPVAKEPAFQLSRPEGVATPKSVSLAGDRLAVEFDDESRAEFQVTTGPGVAVFRLAKFDPKAPVETFRLFRLAAPAGVRIGQSLNAASTKDWAAAVMTAEPKVNAFPETTDGATTLNAASYARHGLEPAAFGIVAAPTSELPAAVERFEHLAGLPSPKLEGVWNKVSPAIRRSYFFLTNFRESQFDEALALAKRGGFDVILIGQESWASGTGHYEIDRTRFPDGLDGLKRTIDRFKAAGFKVGLHFLGPSVYPPDAYLTPVPDPRLVQGAATTLAADVAADDDFLPTADAPAAFPEKDGGYEGAGTILKVGDELIAYGGRSLVAPLGFTKCRRGHLGTKVSAHKKGERVAHLVRAYGYHMFDMDTTLLDEVAANFARVANACAIDMIYFDGSERLQGEHWYYNARLHKAFWDRLENKDILLQASSYSPYSWHLMARSASADGHGDLKGYLDERSPWFDAFERDALPLDIGWYYGYDPESTLDQYEYILGATIGYQSSMSFQVSVDAAAAHPFTGPLLDLIARYERLRLSGRVPADVKALFRIDPKLGGTRVGDQRADQLALRREFRLVGPEGAEAFQRVVYDPWHEIQTKADLESTWPVRVVDGPARVGFWVHVQPGPWLDAGPSYRDPQALALETFDDLAPYAADPAARRNVPKLEPGEAGATSPGVTQRVELRRDGPSGSGSYALYSATSPPKAAAEPAGWSVIQKSFPEPIDLSWHRAIGFWMQGDGRGGALKVQLRDTSPTAAMDYYVNNDFVGWRYQQLERPAQDAIDYRRVQGLLFYYNGLPAETTVTCGVDGVKALRSLDTPGIVDPWVEVDGKRLEWKGKLEQGQYLAVRPGEPSARYAPRTKAPELSAEPSTTLELPAGRESTVRFGCRGELAAPVRVRVTLQPPERHGIPAP
ncbi:hypothetical protein [Planctomyces sp. SH-PL62]|uniref:hypothetical protein n=1 Tax=Planctomyces sp. SH-PL62 TaxID=1636152 RepID=UPI00078D7FC9|nr:hypothetical protein [Planctomyces sp. SH-PL62]AMV37531.1 hypothetical protein VT85_08850 [Planctomyces sp. SH-PL62]